MFSITALVLAALSVAGVMAQESSSRTTLVVTSSYPSVSEGATGTTLSVAPTFPVSVVSTTSVYMGPGPMSLSCVGTTTVNGVATTVPIDSSNINVIASAGVQCWEIYSIGGGTARVPVTATTVTLGSSTAAAVPEDGIETSSSSDSVDVIVPAVIGSIAGLAVIAVAAILYSRYRARKSQAASRPRVWADKSALGMPSGGMVTDKEMIGKPQPISMV